MKLIDLLNKIANGEKVPEKIIVLDNEFYYDKDNLKYRNIEKTKDDLFEHLDFYKGLALNDEVEIIEDKPKKNKKIKELNLEFKDGFIKEHFKGGSTSYLSEYTALKLIYEKQCEIINKLNGEYK